MERFCGIAQKQGILKLPKNASIYGSPKAVNKALMRADEDREKYLLVTTGHQGEPDALLPRIASNRTPFNIKEEIMLLFLHRLFQIQQMLLTGILWKVN